MVASGRKAEPGTDGTGFRPRRDLSGYRAQDWDLRIADLHYRDMREWAVGRNSTAGWDASEDSANDVSRVWTDPLPLAEVERVAPNEDAEFKAQVTFGMEALAQLAEGDGAALRAALADLPLLYGIWIDAERNKLVHLPARRRETGERLVAEMVTAKDRIAKGIEVLSTDTKARTAFRFMNLSVSMAARRRIAGATGDPSALDEPQWRPFQLAFILLNMAGLIDRSHVDRETADLLFFPTGGGKTEAYLGLAALVIAHRRLGGSPQAKGRIERAFGTLQDRLVKELRLAGIDTIDAANEWLPTFMADHNRRFAKPPKNDKDLHRPLAATEQLTEILTTRHERTVSANLTVHYDRMMLILDPTPFSRPLAGKRVMIVNYPDGGFAIQHRGMDLPFRVFDKIRTMESAQIIENKRLSVLLRFGLEWFWTWRRSTGI